MVMMPADPYSRQSVPRVWTRWLPWRLWHRFRERKKLSLEAQFCLMINNEDNEWLQYP